MAKCLWGKAGSEWAYEWPIVGGREIFSRLNMIRKCIFGSFERRNEGKIRAEARDLGDFFNGRYVCKTRDLASYLLPVTAFAAADLGKEKELADQNPFIDHKLRGNIVELELDSSLGYRGDTGCLPVTGTH